MGKGPKTKAEQYSGRPQVLVPMGTAADAEPDAFYKALHQRAGDEGMTVGELTRKAQEAYLATPIPKVQEKAANPAGGE